MLKVFSISFILAPYSSMQANYMGKSIMEGVQFENICFIKTLPAELTFNSSFISIIL